MKKMILMTSLVAISLQGMDGGRFAQTAENPFDRPDQVASTGNLPNKTLIGENAVYQLGIKKNKGTLSFRSETEKGKTTMIECPNWLRDKIFEARSQGQISVRIAESAHGKLFSIDITPLVFNLPVVVNFPTNVLIDDKPSISPELLVANTIAYAYSNGIEQATAHVEVLSEKGSKRALFVNGLESYLPKKIYEQIAQNGPWAPFIAFAKKAARQAVDQGAQQLAQLQQGAQQQINQVKNQGDKAAKGFMQTFSKNRIYTATCIGFGAALASLVFWWRSR